MSDDGKKFNYKSAIILSIAAIIVICVISVFFGVMPPDALPANYMGAALGSLIGALITLVLLRGQTDIEEKKGKDIKILEKKVAVFQDYIKEVWKVWEDQKITIEEFQKLTSKYYQNLMIYLKKDRLEKTGNYLSSMGKNIGMDNYDAISKLRESIIGIINELSAELELGGKVNEEIMDEHDKIVFPLLFKKSILEEADKVLPINKILERGKFEFVKEFRDEPSLEYLCFSFIKYEGCKIVVNGFNWNGEITGNEEMSFIILVDPNHYEFDGFRCGTGRSAWVHRIQFYDDNGKKVGCNLLDPINGEESMEKSLPINFSNEKSMEEYRTKKRGFAAIFARRIAHYFNETKIDGVGIPEFLEKHYEKQGEK